MERGPLKRKIREGVVVSNKMQKTVTVKVDRKVSHPYYGKMIIRGKRYYAHTESTLPVGTKVAIVETKPLSKLKRWRVFQVHS